MKKKTVDITQPETEHFTVQLQTKVHPATNSSTQSLSIQHGHDIRGMKSS